MSSGLQFKSHPILKKILDSITNSSHVGASLQKNEQV